MAPQHLQNCLLCLWWLFWEHKLRVVFQLLSPRVHKQLWVGFSFALSSWHNTRTTTLLYELLPHGSFSGLSLEMVRSVASSSGTPFPSLLKVEDVLASFPKPLASQPMHAPVPLVSSIMTQHAPDNLPMPFTQYQQAIINEYISKNPKLATSILHLAPKLFDLSLAHSNTNSLSTVSLGQPSGLVVP
ncbi:hypothetical protein NE237_019104 [Protea cynaroides]|uniref:Uncharacterized protein n=1 Tax=Protea cynaroides TaxID=273540 RepID=A0A9Q0QPJ7_9MAGN|nr:hypothetical protein NE237_019104 [Protea cynaroides]